VLSPKSERRAKDADSPQLAMFGETEELVDAPAAEASETETEEVVAPIKRLGERKPLPDELPRVEVIHQLPAHELMCACGACKQVIAVRPTTKPTTMSRYIASIKRLRDAKGAAVVTVHNYCGKDVSKVLAQHGGLRTATLPRRHRLHTIRVKQHRLAY
jgi:hypothetical protein